MNNGKAQRRLLCQRTRLRTLRSFQEVVDVPLVARRSTRHRDAILRMAGIDAGDARPRVLVGLRNTLPDSTLGAAARSGSEFVFVVTRPVPGVGCENLRAVQLSPMLSFIDLLSVCDATVCKLGYGMLADCISCNTAILFPPRRDFREDEVLRPAADRWTRSLEVPVDVTSAEVTGVPIWSGWSRSRCREIS